MAIDEKTAVVGDSTAKPRLDNSEKWQRVFICDCGHTWGMVSYCNWQFCPICNERVWDSGLVQGEEVRRKPLTASEVRRLSWYKNEKKWIEDISKRRNLPNGDVAIVDHRGRVEEVRNKDGY